MKKKNRGFTLLEIIVAMGVAAIAFGALVPVVSMLYRMNHTANNMAQAQVLAQTVAAQLDARLRYARSVTILDALPADTAGDERSFIHTARGQVYQQQGGADTLLSADRGYAYNYSVEFTPGEGGVVQAHITVLGEDGPAYDLTEPIYIHNLESGSIGGLDQGGVAAYLPPAREDVAVTSVIISAEDSVILENEQTLALGAEVFPLGATNRRVAWSVDDPMLATVTPGGLLIPLRNGAVTVTAAATDGSGVQGQCTVFIYNQEEKITALTLDTETGAYTIRPGGSLQIVPTFEPGTAFNQQLAWKVDNQQIAAISPDGLLTVRSETSEGSVIVTAATQDGSHLTRTIEILIE